MSELLSAPDPSEPELLSLVEKSLTDPKEVNYYVETCTGNPKKRSWVLDAAAIDLK